MATRQQQVWGVRGVGCVARAGTTTATGNGFVRPNADRQPNSRPHEPRNASGGDMLSPQSRHYAVEPVHTRRRTRRHAGITHPSNAATE